MVELDYFKALIWPDRGWRLQWRFDDIDPAHTIHIERASGPEGPWGEVAQVPATDVVYEDPTIPQRSLFTVVYYRLKVFDGQNNLLSTSKPTTNRRRADRISAEMIRRHELTLKGVNGQDGYFATHFACFKRAVNGTPCDCVDEFTGDRLRDRCPLCLGTGYLEGWSTPVTFRGRFKGGERQQQQVHNDGEDEQLRRQFWTVHYPILEPGDIVVEKQNDRHWRVISINTSVPNNVVVSQNVTAERLAHDQIENELHYPS